VMASLEFGMKRNGIFNESPGIRCLSMCTASREAVHVR